jgi:hypothetical protein
MSSTGPFAHHQLLDCGEALAAIQLAALAVQTDGDCRSMAAFEKLFVSRRCHARSITGGRMLDLAAHRKDKTVAFIATLVLLLQTFFASWSLAAAPHDGTLDALGNPLCITSSDHGPTPSDGSFEGPTCCTLGCSMSSTVLHTPAPDALPVRQEVEADVQVGIEHALPRARPDHDPGSPRAPPLTA